MQPSHLPILVLPLFLVVSAFALAGPGSGPYAPGLSATPASTLILAGRGGGASSSSEAAEQARRQTGGKVLSVRKSGGGYEVKVLTPAGEVRIVFVPAAGG
jgi:hypothetical protein